MPSPQKAPPEEDVEPVEPEDPVLEDPVEPESDEPESELESPVDDESHTAPIQPESDPDPVSVSEPLPEPLPVPESLTLALSSWQAAIARKDELRLRERT
jgi:hypothetical protein